MNTDEVVRIFYSRARMYDVEYADYTADLAFNVQLARELVGDGMMLEFCCGTGRVTLELAKAGINVIGVDITPEMLEVAKEKLTRAYANGDVEGKVRLLQGDMRVFDAGLGQYKYVLVPFTSFLHLTIQQDQKQTLANARAHLEPGGYFLADVFAPDIQRLAGYLTSSDLNHEKVATSDEMGIRMVRLSHTRYDPVTQIISQTWYYQIYESEGARRLLESYWVPIQLRAVFPAEWALLLEGAGFRIVERWGGFGREPFGPKSGRILWLCQKS